MNEITEFAELAVRKSILNVFEKNRDNFACISNDLYKELLRDVSDAVIDRIKKPVTISGHKFDYDQKMAREDVSIFDPRLAT